MERFSYPNIAAVEAEDAELVRMMRIVELGRGDPDAQ